jgi:hypothetical protein
MKFYIVKSDVFAEVIVKNMIHWGFGCCVIWWRGANISAQIAASVFSVKDGGTRTSLILSSTGHAVSYNISAGSKSYVVKMKIRYDVSGETMSRVIKNIEPIEANC